MTERQPDERGYFGSYGGRFVPETIMNALEELERQRSSTSSRILRALASGSFCSVANVVVEKVVQRKETANNIQARRGLFCCK